MILYIINKIIKYTRAELGLKVRGANFKDCLFTIFENCFLLLKVRRIRKTCLVSSFFVMKNIENTKNNKFKEQVLREH